MMYQDNTGRIFHPDEIDEMGIHVYDDNQV